MDYRILYEAPTAVPFPWTAVAAGVICIILAAIMIIFRKKIKFIAGLTLFFFAFMCLYISARGLIDFFDRRDNILKGYISGECFTAEGKIESYTKNFNGKPGVDCFTVDGMIFTTGNVGYFGYHYTSANGGELKDGLKVIITYVPHGFDNIIMKLEVGAIQEEE